MMQPGRKFSSASGYRYGFNGKGNDNEVKGEGNQEDYGMRIYDTRIGKFLSVDPLAKKYPQLTPYAFAENDVLSCVDLDGLERYFTADGKLIDKFGTDQTIKVVDDRYVKTVAIYVHWANVTKLENMRSYALGKANEISQNVYDTKDKAAEGWGKIFNKKSIDSKKEYASNMYEVKIEGKNYTTYTTPVVGRTATANEDENPAPYNKVRSGIIHSHGGYDPRFKNDEFSKDGGDIDHLNNRFIDGYLTTPNGSLFKYNFKTKEITLLSIDMPKDLLDPIKPGIPVKPVEPVKPVQKVKPIKTSKKTTIKT